MYLSAFRVLYIYRQTMTLLKMTVPSRYLWFRTKTTSFGLLIDIDGVVVQGNLVIPRVLETFKKLTSSEGQFVFPTLFVTNSGNQLAKEKAEQLSKWLEIKVTEDHVVCSHDPFRVFHNFHDKNILVTGQGRVEEVAKAVGFKKVVTVENLLKDFPMLDATDVSRRVSQPIPKNLEYSSVEAVVLFGEPVRWESSLQIVTDILLTNGDPRRFLTDHPYPHIPVLACNMDLQWRFAVEIPRFGHGVFLLCLESVYKKITAKDLQYQVMVGKPSIVTYKYAQKMIMNQARELGVHGKIKNVYMIGDNINTDIFGGNLYNDYLSSGDKDVHYDPSVDTERSITNCFTILVKTGVSSAELLEQQMNHVHRDFLGYDKAHRQPTHIAQDLSAAIDLIFQLEQFS